MHELDISHDNGKSYETIGRFETIEKAKTKASKINRSVPHSAFRRLFRIYSSNGKMLLFTGSRDRSLRMNWCVGNRMPRGSQSGEYIRDPHRS